MSGAARPTSIKPDILTCAKALSSAYLPISAVLMNEKVYQALLSESDKIGTFGHGYTYSGHPVAAAVALETLKIYEEIDLVGHAAPDADLPEALQRSPTTRWSARRRVGLIGAVEIVADKKTKAPFERGGAAGPGRHRAQEHGLICASSATGRGLPAADHHRDGD